MDEGFPRMKYADPCSSDDCHGSSSYTVQFHYYRRELIEEIEFLTLCLEAHDDYFTLLVIGSAPGYDLMFLMELFPNMKLILFDPKPTLIKKSERVEIHKTLFNERWAHRIKQKLGDMVVYMQCYTRIDHSKLQCNLTMVKEWHSIIRPRRGAYEFTLPYDSDENTEFIKGDKYLPVWSKPTGADSRIITAEDTNETQFFGHREHEEHMMFFNTIMRPSQFSTKNVCYDCYAESVILNTFLRKFKLKGSVEKLSKYITRHFDPFPQMPDWYTSHHQKKKSFGRF